MLSQRGGRKDVQPDDDAPRERDLANFLGVKHLPAARERDGTIRNILDFLNIFKLRARLNNQSAWHFMSIGLRHGRAGF
jgi:hypothetical protein